MGMADHELEMVEAYGIPQFFITEVRAENAGGGCMRVFGCARQRGVLVPQYSVVMPFRALLLSAARVARVTREMVQIETGCLIH